MKVSKSISLDLEVYRRIVSLRTNGDRKKKVNLSKEIENFLIKAITEEEVLLNV